MAPRKASMKSTKRKKGEPYDPPFPSPVESDGPSVPPPRAAPPEAVLRLGSSGQTGFANIQPTGFPTEYNMCYRNAALSLLMNIPSFVGYLDHFSVRSRDDGDNVLFELGEMATAYWSDITNEERREKLSEAMDGLWQHLLYLNYDDRPCTTGWGPFLDSDQREMQQDAGDFLENLLNNGDAECEYRQKDRLEYSAMVEAAFQPRRACAANCEHKRTRGAQLDRARLWTVHISQSDGAVAGTLEDAIRTTMTNEIDHTCKKCKKLGKEGKMGRIWLRLRDAPEILFIRISRFERTKRGRVYRKCNNEVTVPEVLDMTTYLEDSDKQDGITAQYRLCGAINHAGTMDSGHFVSHVRGPNRQWYRLDDETVTDSSIATLNSEPAKHGKHIFTPYILAYTKIRNDDLSPDPPLRPPTPPPTPAPALPTARFRVQVTIAGQAFTMTRRFKDYDPGKPSYGVAIQADIADADGNALLGAEPVTVQLVRGVGGSSRVEKQRKGPKSPRTPRKKFKVEMTGLASPSPTPVRATTRARSEGEEGARVHKGV